MYLFIYIKQFIYFSLGYNLCFARCTASCLNPNRNIKSPWKYSLITVVYWRMKPDSDARQLHHAFFPTTFIGKNHRLDIFWPL